MITNPGEIGIIQDIPGHELPLNAFSDGQNVRFNDTYVEKSLGHSVPFTPSVAPYYLLAMYKTEVFYWIYAGLTAIYITEGTNHSNASGTSYATTVNDGWDGDSFEGIPILCNEFDPPQALYPVSPGNTFSDLSNWPANYLARVVKRFGNYLVALCITKNGIKYPTLVKTSHQADPGTLPSSWDYTDPSLDATETPLSNVNGEILNGGILGDAFIIYAEGSTHEMRLIGGQNIFGYRTLFSKSGMFAKKCFAAFANQGVEQHCVLTNDDLIVHDGHTYRSIVDMRYKNTLFTELAGATYANRAFLAANYRTDEIWICYPTGANTQCTKALIWNYRHDTFAFRDITANYIAFDIVDPTTTATWDSDSDTWDSDSTVWDTRLFNPSKRYMLMADANNTKIYKIDDTNQFNAVNFTSYIQRDGLGVVKGGKVDTTSRKRFKTLFPRITGSGTITIYLGTQDAPGGTITWDSGTSFVIGTDYKLDAMLDGRMLAYKIQSTGDVSWRFHGMDGDIEVMGKQ